VLQTTCRPNAYKFCFAVQNTCRPDAYQFCAVQTIRRLYAHIVQSKAASFRMSQLVRRGPVGPFFEAKVTMLFLRLGRGGGGGGGLRGRRPGRRSVGGRRRARRACPHGRSGGGVGHIRGRSGGRLLRHSVRREDDFASPAAFGGPPLADIGHTLDMPRREWPG
jgi:hypothetical protein